MENSDIGLFLLALVAITGTLISLFERRINKPARPLMKSQATKVQRRS
ncbi:MULTISPECIES: hypothetical protein [Pseudomonas]|uniref:Uncharacterized protein n=1 Tax=Pseudomonas shirazica TaxID=1940636 RepID=A0ABY9SUN8_9PSED|nr:MULTISPECIES: hypothetical protein [Pseudomonas]CAB5605550.1 Uncharacterised protein [Pseudomonas putida]MBO2921595.1 hypothetical protein [Pseudomonas asiatica]MCO7525316.1 hypothetical protein [Pseudomonas asiatica]MDH4431337.1 hypothetical protein [Pseudomonas shirazica]WMY87214.1 hypothetical protein QR297_10350 [Pseudomonas shirazica]